MGATPPGGNHCVSSGRARWPTLSTPRASFGIAHNQNCIDALVSIMLDRACPERGEVAAYALANMVDRSPVWVFLACLEDPTQDEKVRGEAAEGIAIRGEFHPRQRKGVLRKGEAALIRNLSDPSPTVRFWCCFALACLRSTRAVPALTLLRDHDTAVAPGWWYVHEEAADALATIDGVGTSNDRIPVHLRSVGGVAVVNATALC